MNKRLQLYLALLAGGSMNASLRLRLALLVVCSVALSVALVLYLTWQRVGETMIGMEEKNFSTLLLVEEERLNTATLNHLSAKVRSVIMRKAQLRDASARVQALLRALAPQRAAGDGQGYAALQPLLSDMDAASIDLRDDFNSIRMEILDTEKLHNGQTSLLGLTSGLRDAKQQPVRRLLRRLSRNGDFAVFDLPRLVAFNGGRIPSGTYRPVLTYFLPLDDHSPSREVLVSMLPLDDLEKMAARAQAQLLKDTWEKFREMSLYPGGLVALLDGDGHILVSGGDGKLPDGLDAARAQAGQAGMAKVILPSAQGDMLCLLGGIRAFGWYVALIAPLDEIRKPSDSLLARLLAVSLPIMLLAALAALLMLVRTLRPLKLLTRKTRRLADVDFAAPDALDQLKPLLSQGLPLDRRDELGQLARAYANLGGALAANIRNLMEATASKERMEGELSAAREIQMGILPPPDGAPEMCGFRASAFLDPAKEVGGDMYDFFVTSDGRRALVLGDVSGKGVPAALFMSMTVTLVRYALGSGIDPAAAMSRVNAMLEAHNPGNMFVTLFLALYDPQSGELSYANGGHCPPYIIDAASDAPPRMLDKLSGPLVGVIPDMEYTLFTDTLREQETCLLFTDGVTEAMNSAKELYGEARLQDFLAAHRGASPQELLTLIFSELVRFRGEEPQSDDITMLAFCRTHSAGAAQPASTARTSS